MPFALCVFQAEVGIRYWSVTGVQTCAFFFSSRRRHTRLVSDWSSDVCSSDLRRSNLHCHSNHPHSPWPGTCNNQWESRFGCYLMRASKTRGKGLVEAGAGTLDRCTAENPEQRLTEGMRHHYLPSCISDYKSDHRRKDS